MRVGVIGAGLAGLAAAHRLQAAGASVVVFDKGRGPGGRLSTRRMETPFGTARFDHGAQYVTARAPAFQAALARLVASGHAAPWEARFQPEARGPRFVGTPGMSGIVKGLAEGLDVRFGVRVAPLAAGASALTDEAGAPLGAFERIVCAVPAEQAADLLAHAAPELAAQARAARNAPCWAAMLAFDGPVPASFDAAEIQEGPIAWAARERSKPGRAGPEAWVVHAGAAFSAERLEDAPDAVAAALAAAFERLTGARAGFAAAHRWRFARVEAAAGTPFALSADRRLGVCGDWRLGARAEAAFLSGDALGAAMAVTGGLAAT